MRQTVCDMVDVIISSKYKIKIAHLVSQVINNLYYIRSISFRYPVLHPKCNSCATRCTITKSRIYIYKSFRHMIIQEVQKLSVGAEINFQIISKSVGKLCSKS